MAKSHAFLRNAHPGLRRAARRPHRTGAMLSREVTRQGQQASDRIRQATPRATGRTARSTDSVVVQSGPRFYRAEISQEGHARFVESGTRPHELSGRHLIAWAKHRMRGDYVKAAYAIAQAIAEHGTKGYNYTKRPIEETRRTAGPALRAALRSHVRSIVR